MRFDYCCTTHLFDADRRAVNCLLETELFFFKKYKRIK
jgi:hypothetical protein